jgi:hypothetical protein
MKNIERMMLMFAKRGNSDDVNRHFHRPSTSE